jgi:hypothetical protein
VSPQAIQDAAAGAGLSMTSTRVGALMAPSPAAPLHTRVHAAQEHTHSRHFLSGTARTQCLRIGSHAACAEALARGPLPPMSEWSEQLVP